MEQRRGRGPRLELRLGSWERGKREGEKGRERGGGEGVWRARWGQEGGGQRRKGGEGEEGRRGGGKINKYLLSRNHTNTGAAGRSTYE